MNMRNDLTASYVRSILDYDSSSGAFHWNERPLEHFKTQHGCSSWNARFAGKRAGSKNGRDYFHIRINGSQYRSNRLAWLWMTGEWPKAHIDHIDCDKTNDRWANLREATHAQNMANKPVQQNNTSGFKGVSWHKQHGKWQAYIKLNGRRRYIGYFDDLEQAAAAYQRAAIDAFGSFARSP